MATKSAFPSFSRFPPELRMHIWSQSLPSQDGPTVCFYKKDCWRARLLLPTEKAYDTSDPFNWTLEFRHDLLDPVRVKVPQYLVNFEARSSALKWAREMNLEVQAIDQQDVMLRPMDPTRDVMYVGLSDAQDFRAERDERLFQPDLQWRTVDVRSAAIQHIALPEALLRRIPTLLYEISDLYTSVKVVYIIPSTIPEIQAENTTTRRWELDCSQQAKYWWDAETQGFRWQGEREAVGKEMHELVEKAGGLVRAALVNDAVQAFEIQPASMIPT